MSTLVRSAGGVRRLSQQIRQRELSPVDLVERCLTRIDAIDGEVQAWIDVDAETARKEAEDRCGEAGRGEFRGALHGIPFGVKDVLDVAGFPTRAGSRVRGDAQPATLDATIVARLRAAGGVFLGKLHTTEFAYFDGVPPTRNPHDTARTPGGSSAGSAAAVAAGMVPLALGTQTAGSICRPAAFCGVGAFKPTTLSVGGAGMVPLAPSFDTPGLFAQRAGDAAFAMAAAMPYLAVGTVPDPGPVILLQDPLIEEMAEAAMQAAMVRFADELGAAGVAAEPRPSPVPFEAVLANHRSVLLYEAARCHACLLDRPDLIGARLAADLSEGLRIPQPAWCAALSALDAQRRRFWDTLPPDALVVLPAAAGIAPAGMETGDPRLVTVMTALGGPLASIRVTSCPQTGLPLGAMLGAAPGRDAALMRLAMRAEAGPLAR